MPNDYFTFKQFTIRQDMCAFKVGTDGVLLGAYADVTGAKRILDIGSGTGLVAIMLAQRSPAEIVAIEPDVESFHQLVNNIEDCKWKDRIQAVNDSVQNYDPGFSFGLIVSNPPYFINSIRNPDNRKSGARHNDTLPHDELLASVTRMLEENGRFQVIMPFAEGNVLVAEAAAYGLHCNEILKIKPLPSSEVRRLVLTFSRQKMRVSEKFLTIEHGSRHEFTEAYRALISDFYLKF
ncbi:MAG: tRNA1(Val) (adenine(37)-N6)-methyltransferase [Chloroflexota bacterium]